MIQANTTTHNQIWISKTNFYANCKRELNPPPSPPPPVITLNDVWRWPAGRTSAYLSYSVNECLLSHRPHHEPECVQKIVAHKRRISNATEPINKICRLVNTRVGTLIVATIYLQLIQNRYVSKFYCPSV